MDQNKLFLSIFSIFRFWFKRLDAFLIVTLTFWSFLDHIPKFKDQKSHSYNEFMHNIISQIFLKMFQSWINVRKTGKYELF